MVECAIAALKKLLLSRFCNGTEPHAPLDESGSISLAAQFHHSAAFAMPSVCSLRYFPGAVEDYGDGPDDLTPRHRLHSGVNGNGSPCH